MRRSILPRGSEAANVSHDSTVGTAPPPLPTARGVVLAQHLIDASIVGILFLAPLVLGGRHPLGELALILAALPGTIGVAIKVMAGRRLPLTYWQVGLLLACYLIPLGQSLSVAPAWVRWASPGIEQLFGETPQLTTSERLHDSFSVSAATTEKSLPIIIAYLCVFTLLMVRLDSIADVERLLMILVAATLLLTVLALLQANFGNGRFVWWYDHPSKSPDHVPRGPFQNENHLASLLATALPCMLYFLFRESKRRAGSQRTTTAVGLKTLFGSHYRRWLAAATCMLVVVTVYATPSRGGAAIIALAAAVWIAFVGWIWLRQRYVRQVAHGTWLRVGAVGGTTLALVGVAVMYSVVEHYSYWRAKLWQADLAAWRDFPVLGVGVGNHRYIYRAYLDEYWYQTFSVAESSWIQLLVETGAVGVGVTLIAVGLLAVTLLRTMTRHESGTVLFLCGALGAGLAASCVHACGDFPWHVPACFVVVLVLVACLCRLSGLSRSAGTTGGALLTQTLSPNMSWLLALALLIGNVWAIRAAVPEVRAAQSWDAYRRLIRDQPTLRVAAGNDPATQLLKETLRHDPYHVLARVKLAGRMAAEFEAQRFQMDDPQQRAGTILRHTLVLAAICPTESRTYLYAALSSGALGASLEKQQMLLAQSQRLRLVDGRVALRQGLNAIMLQDEATADKQFAIALNADPSFRESAVQTLRMLYSAEKIVARWQPGRDTSALLYRSCRTHPTSSEQVVVGRHYCECLQADAAKCDSSIDKDQLLAAAAGVAAEIDDHALSLQLAHQRWELDPRNINRLLARAKAFHQLGQVEEARADIARCLQIAPHDQDTRRFALQLDHQSNTINR